MHVVQDNDHHHRSVVNDSGSENIFTIETKQVEIETVLPQVPGGDNKARARSFEFGQLKASEFIRT